MRLTSRTSNSLVGCIGNPDCEISLVEAIEEDEKPEKKICPEDDVASHIISTDRPCATHQHNRAMENLIKSMILLQKAIRRGGRRPKPANIKTVLCEGKVILPLSLLAALTLDTMCRGRGEYSEDDLEMIPHYVLIVYDKLLKARVIGKDCASASLTVSLAEKTLERSINAEIVSTTLKATELNREIILILVIN